MHTKQADYNLWVKNSKDLVEKVEKAPNQENIVRHLIKECKTLQKHFADDYKWWKNDLKSEEVHYAERLNKQIHADLVKLEQML